MLQELAKHLPQLQAEESLRRAAEIALGSGTLNKHDARELRSLWLRAARVGSRRKAVRAGTPADLETTVAAMGIELVKVKADG
ncbi:MAG: hypothetical protein M3T56_10330 [Chloroflexota bacterium]|nr:hypothetical protein [Chloroflexota bacterium]